MSDEPIVHPAGQPKKRRGRPKKNPDIISPDGKTTEKPPERPLCEKSELAKYPPEGKVFIWGSEPLSPGFKRKGLAVLFNPADPGGMVTLMPVTDGEDGEPRWRYRFIKGFCPYRYEKIDLEPGMVASLPATLRAIADGLERGVKSWFGGQKEADKTTEVFQDKVKGDMLTEKLKKMGGMW